ncbi:MAG: hypothetical protein Kow006_28060 [Gammaproteobacteria bacterium]
MAALLLLGGCASTHRLGPEAIYEIHGIAPPAPGGFEICYNHGCAARARVALTPAEWASVLQIFSPPPETPRAERQRIARAIARLETLTGEKTGTSADLGGTFPGLFTRYQMDCIDESVNTTVYLTMLEQAGRLRFHRLAGTATRGFFLRGWPHTAATLLDTLSGEIQVVDSWFEANGGTVHIVGLEQWMDGWRPEGSE